MNSNQKSQVEKILRIEEANEDLRNKIQKLQATISKNERKIEKIRNFLSKQSIGKEEIEDYILGISSDSDFEEISKQEDSDSNSQKTNLFSEMRTEKTN